MTTKKSSNGHARAREARHPEVLRIDLDRIYVRDDGNIRSNLPNVQAMTRSFAEKGQLEPIGVHAGGPEGFDYTLRFGYRRTAAAHALEWKTILALVRPKGDALSEAADNWVENDQRERVTTIDRAERAYDLLTGAYVAAGVAGAQPVSREDLAKLLELSRNALNKLLRIRENLSDELRAEARRVKAPTRLLILLSTLKTEEAQRARLDAWVADQEALAKAGRKRAKRGSKTNGKGGDGDGEEGEARPALPLSKKIGGVSVEEIVRVAEEKRDGSASKADRVRFQGVVDALHFVTGRKRSIAGITKRDLERSAASAEAEA